MKKEVKCIAFITILLLYKPDILVAEQGHTFFAPRSQSVDAALELVGWQKLINIPTDCVGACYSTFSATVEYTQSWRNSQLAEYFFGCPIRTFSGSLSVSRGKDDILADYFGLPTDFKSSVNFQPIVRNVLVDFDWYQSLDNICQGAYIRIHAPLVCASWHMQIYESIENEGTNAFPSGYMASGVLERPQLERSVKQAFCRNQAIGDIQPLTAGRICCDARTKTNGAEVQVAVGHNPILTDTSHFGWNIRASIPTGGRSRGDLLFEPIIGNGSHWECGVGLTGHDTFWSDECCNHSLSLYCDLNVTHLFTARQRRSFDFVHNGCLSRYMLLEQLSRPLVSGLSINTGTPVVEVPVQQQYSGVLLPAVNQTTLYANIRNEAQADFVAKVAYQYKSFACDIGYNAWVRSHEKIGCRQQFPSDLFAIKGDAQIYGFEIVDPAFFVALNATQHLATIHAGQGDGNSNFTNTNADNTGPAIFNAIPLVTSNHITAVNGSAQAVLLTDCDIDEASGLAPKAVSHTVFVHVSYDWQTCKRATPFLGAGASVELSGTKGAALSQWGVWLKAGMYR